MSKPKKGKLRRPKRKNFLPSELSPNDQELLEDLLDRLGINTWDWLLIGDGSGSDRSHQCGWGCVSIERATFERLAWFGAMNRGTVNLAEMMAYLQPLNFIAAQEDDRKKKTGRRRGRLVHIITDSEYCRTQGDSDNLLPKRNGALWRIFDDYQRHGLVLCWHWLPRTDVALNVYVDAISKAARHLLVENDVLEMVDTDGKGAVLRTVYDYNPSYKPRS